MSILIIITILVGVGFAIHIYSRTKSKRFLPKSYDVGEEYFKIRNPSVNISESDNNERQYIHNLLYTSKKKKVNIDLTKHGKLIGSVEMGGLFGVGMMHKYLAIDDHVFNGIENLSGKQFDTIVDLSMQVQSYKHNFWGSLTEKGRDKLGGHIGESYSAAHFEESGIEVAWPEFSNQKGWDLLLNGHEVNVKLVEGFRSLSNHFSEYPNIPVVVPGDMQNVPPDAIHFDPENGVQNVLQALKDNSENLVIVDQTLSHADTMGQTADATDMLIGGANSAEAAAGGVPFVTMAVSGWREYKLIEKQKTDIKTATKNIGLDVAGIGGGGLAGAKGGAIIGSFLGPPGTVVGGVIGAIGGAIGGRHFSDKIKFKKYNKALKRYNEKQKLLEYTIINSEKKAQEKWEEYYFERQEILMTKKEKTELSVKQSIDEVRKWRISSEKIDSNEAINYLIQCEDHLNSLLHEINHERSSLSLFSRFYLAHQLLTFKYAQKKIERMRNQVLKEKSEIAQSKWVDRSSFLCKIGEMGLLKEKVISDLKRFEEKRLKREKTLRTLIEDSQSKLINYRVETSKKLTSYLKKLTNEVKNNTKKAVNDVRKAGETLEVEANKFGK